MTPEQSAHAIADDVDLAFWLGEALAHNRAVTAGRSAAP